jgi:DNA-binding beta-propeller fold protein YncE
MVVDLDHHRLFVAALGNGTVEVVDLDKGKVTGRIGNLREPQGLAYLASSNELVVATGDGTVRFYRADDLVQSGDIKLGDDADNVRIDPTTGSVVVGYGDGALAVIDPVSRKLSGTIALSAHPESFQIDQVGRRAFVNLPGAGQIAVADLATMKITNTRRASYGANYPMLFDAASNAVIVAYRSPSRLVISNASDGTVRQDIELCNDGDDLFLDAKRQLIYVSCGSGILEVFAASNKGYQPAAQIKTRAGARTSLLVSELDRLYVAARASAGTEAAILVFRPN